MKQRIPGFFAAHAGQCRLRAVAPPLDDALARDDLPFAVAGH